MPRAAWHVLRALSVASFIGLVVLLLVAPTTGLTLTWGLVVPLLPAIWLFAPGLWRNACPLATMNQLPRLLGFSRARTLPPRVAAIAYVVGIALFLGLASMRQVVFQTDGAATALMLIWLMALAFAGGVAFKGRSGWCSTFCPLLPVQRAYGQTPAVVVPNAFCKPCVGCAKNCYDFNPTAAQLADLHDDDPRYRGYRTFFVGLFPGFIVGFFNVPADAPALERLGLIALAAAVSLAVFTALATFLRLSTFRLAALFAGLAWTLFYLFGLPVVARALSQLTGLGPIPEVVVALQGAVVVAALVWLARTFGREAPFLARAAGRASARVSKTVAVQKHLRTSTAGPDVTFHPDGRHVAARMEQPLLEVIEGAGLKIESGCRMGVCGADPVAVLEGREHLCPVGDDERATLERLGLSSTTRMACMARVRGPVTVSLTPRKAADTWGPGPARGGHDEAVRRLVIVGNGIAGVTAADFARRSHPSCEIHLVARESVHLYNRMALGRVIYGRTALHGLFLLPEAWYEEHRVQTWLNTRATRVDREAREVHLATGERLGYDRLVLATGAEAFVPPVAGVDLKGSFSLRTADDAVAIRSFVQEHGCANVVVVGAGLLGLETAYALHKIGRAVTVLERGPHLMARQLDARGAAVLERYLAGLGIAVLSDAAVKRASPDGRGRVVSVDLEDGRILACDLLCLCIGIRPDTRLAADAGLACTPRGVVVDGQLRTSDPHILAAGDVVDFPGQVGGLWPVAVEQAKLAAVNAVCLPERHKPFVPIVPVTMLKVSGIDVLSLGLIAAEREGDVELVVEEPDPRRYRKLVARDGKLAGAIVIGHPELHPSVTAAVKRGRPLGADAARLVAGEWAALAR
ncbi:MAG: FAD-dependent oxidoreductase [Deltaproteobacteria bacterium]|nr:FAD-dependent oxidoreductase [Deltaproteobacteria bacterium]